ncbi:NAD-dependent epimerase/dehydratase family protein [Streptomyces sp. NPDC049813]|uniref:NAD-dependent epimerase/dehydratase family protein n=1 Tax=Streptomyces sp. NPDC049813 TaxID=3365597 RepID=UPI00379612B2
MRIVMTGATGFIGSAVLHSLARVRDAQPGGLHLTALGREARHTGAAAPWDAWHPADLSAPASLARSCQDADVLLHLGGTLSPDARTCHTVNVAGTAALMAEARRARVPRIIHLSTAAVYGRGPHHGLDVDEIEPAPVSPASASRLEAERHTLAAGATVLRPGLVLGPGDRWVVPALRELAERVPALWDGGRSRHSAVTVARLADLITALTLRAEPLPAGVLHASHPRPVTTRELLTSLAELGVLGPLTASWSWDRCLAAFRAADGRISERQFHLLAQDHWYLSEAAWRRAGVDPGPPPHLELVRAADWYRGLVTA